MLLLYIQTCLTSFWSICGGFKAIRGKVLTNPFLWVTCESDIEARDATRALPTIVSLSLSYPYTLVFIKATPIHPHDPNTLHSILTFSFHDNNFSSNNQTSETGHLPPYKPTPSITQSKTQDDLCSPPLPLLHRHVLQRLFRCRRPRPQKDRRPLLLHSQPPRADRRRLHRWGGIRRCTRENQEDGEAGQGGGEGWGCAEYRMRRMNGQWLTGLL